VVTDAVELFWSLSFAVLRRTFLERIGGFDEGFTGYGGEDTDLAFSARAAGVPLAWVPEAIAYHQDHEHHDPPLHHLRDIAVNARRFRERWDVWPMEGWLCAFVDAGLVRWDGRDLEVLRDPTPAELARTRRRTYPGEHRRP
jgi:GT2 family glycosyltransferase